MRTEEDGHSGRRTHIRCDGHSGVLWGWSEGWEGAGAGDRLEDIGPEHVGFACPDEGDLFLELRGVTAGF